MPEQPTELSFPTAWEEHFGDFQPATNGCPICEEQIARYLKDCHYHYALEEEPTDFLGFKLVEMFTFHDRQFWVWSCKDKSGRDWLVLIGSGKSTFAGETCDRIWMFGKTNTTSISAREFLLKEFPEYAQSFGKAN